MVCGKLLIMLRFLRRLAHNTPVRFSLLNLDSNRK